MSNTTYICPCCQDRHALNSGQNVELEVRHFGAGCSDSVSEPEDDVTRPFEDIPWYDLAFGKRRRCKASQEVADYFALLRRQFRNR